MSSDNFDIDSFLSDMADGGNGIIGSDIDGTDESGRDSWQEQGYDGSVDYRIRQLSYSSLLTLHSCPRKFQLNRLRTTHRAEESVKSTITFAFGHVVGDGIQRLFAGERLDSVIWHTFLNWHTDLANVDDKLGKSVYSAIYAIQKLDAMRSSGFLAEYELVYYEGKPACELSFSINFPDGFRLRGFVDAVLRNKISGEIIVLECKTTGAATLNPESFKNSAQAIGYSIVLDHIFPALSSYKVLYLIYQTKAREYTPIEFVKTYLQRALWIRELLLDIEMIKLYEYSEIYPMRGENCFSFYRACEYFNTCSLSTKYLTKPMTEAEVDTTEYQITLTLADLLESQLEKVG